MTPKMEFTRRGRPLREERAKIRSISVKSMKSIAIVRFRLAIQSARRSNETFAKNEHEARNHLF